MKIFLALTAVVLAEGRVVKHNGHGAPVTPALPVSHVAAATSKSHVTINGAASSRTKASGTGKIVPPLVDVDTDKKFFGPPFPADYPDDIQPPAKRALFKKDSVYPKVQEEGFFDKDYVKDENTDGGKWQAQSDYDVARTKIYNQKRQAENARKRAENEARDVANAAKKVKDAKQKEEAAAAEAKAAEEEAKDAAGKAKERADKKGEDMAAEARAKAEEEEHRQDEVHKDLEKKAKEAEKELEKEKESYKDCLRELQEAKAKVEELQEKKDQLKKEGLNTTKTIVAETEDLEKEKQAVEEAKKREAVAEKNHQDAEDKLKSVHEAKEAAARELEQEKAENAKAQAAVEVEEKHVKEAQTDLETSKATLRRIRGLEAVPGETPAPPKAGAAGMSLSLAVATLWACSMAF